MPQDESTSSSSRQHPKFLLGQIVATANAVASLADADIVRALALHAVGDWGDLDDYDRSLNERALEIGDRLFSAYQADDGTKFYVITEWDRSTTTVLLPEDY